MEPLVTLLIPNRSEPMLARTLVDLHTALDDLPITIVVEDDPFATGVGATLRRGLTRVRTEWVIFVMADGSESLVCLRRMLQRIQFGAFDAVWGDRWRRGSVIGYPLVKRLLNRLGNHWLAHRQRVAYADWTDLAKAYRTDRLRTITWDDDFRCAVQIPLRYFRQVPGHRIGIVPMHWVERRIGRSSYRLVYHAWRCLTAGIVETK